MDKLKSIFGFDKQTMTLSKEISGGVTTFLTMAYILAHLPLMDIEGIRR